MFDAELAPNPEPRLACLLLLDVSASLKGAAIEGLNRGLRLFANHLAQDSLASQRVEVAVVRVGGQAQLVQDFVKASGFKPPNLCANGDTPLGAGVLMALQLLNARKQEYRNHGIGYFRPWLLLLSASPPTDLWQEAAIGLQQAMEHKSFTLLSVGVKGADLGVLRTLWPHQPPALLQGLRFEALLVWLAQQMTTVSHSGASNSAGQSAWPIASRPDWAQP